MKIALVTETFPPEVNGVSMTLNRLAMGLCKRGHQLEVVRPRQKNGPPANATFATFCVQGFPLIGYPGLQFGRFALGTLMRRWRRNPPDLIHIATEGPLGLSAIRVACKFKIPCVSTFHTNFQTYTTHYGFAWIQKAFFAYLRWVHNKTLATFAPSLDVQNHLSECGFKNVQLLGRGVDTNLFCPHHRSTILRQKWGSNGNSPIVIYVGRLAAEKNVDLSIRAFKSFRKKIPDAEFVLVGDGPERTRLEKENPDFYFAGMRLGEELAAHYASADLFFFGSTTETFGNVVTEAMASGLIVLAYDYAAGRQHIQNGSNGYTCAFDDETAFIHAVDVIVTDRAHWHSIRQAARETSLGLSWDGIIDSYEKDICNLVARAKPPQLQQAATATTRENQ